jgi:hypothetical protein
VRKRKRKKEQGKGKANLKVGKWEGGREAKDEEE